MKILFIKSVAVSSGSKSTEIAELFINEVKALKPEAEIKTLDLYGMEPFPEQDRDVLNGMFKGEGESL